MSKKEKLDSYKFLISKKTFIFFVVVVDIIIDANFESNTRFVSGCYSSEPPESLRGHARDSCPQAWFCRAL